jgi:hypothetical protein
VMTPPVAGVVSSIFFGLFGETRVSHLWFQLSLRNHQASKHSTLNPQPSTLNPQPSTLKLKKFEIKIQYFLFFI